MTRRFAPFALLLAGCAVARGYPDGRGLEGQLEREVEALQQTVRGLEAQLSICGRQGPPDRIYAELHQVFHNSEIAVDRRGPVTTVSIPGGHLFRADGVGLRDEAMATLDLLSTALNLHPDYRVILEGHTDDRETTGGFASGWDLSYARAAAVMSAMSSRFRVAEHRFTVVARGPNEPVATNDTPAGQARNRRVVLLVHPPGHER